MMFWRDSKEDSGSKVREGALFQRKHPHNLVETARVLSIANDQFGIPHVKYEVKFERAQERGRMFEGPRVLALSVFTDSFRRCAEPS